MSSLSGNSPISTLQSPLLVIIGATAVGKTALSLQVAERFDGEIVSADSRLFYRGMDIGTAKPTIAEQAIAPHHLIDICDPDETITLGDYQDRCYATIDAIHQRGRLPILVGGTGQYVRAIVEGWGIPRVSPQPALRAELEQRSGADLYAQLQSLDPSAAAKIHPNNVRRLVRALEVCLVSGERFSDLQRKSPPPYTIQIIGLRMARSALFDRIDRRVDQMMAADLLAEVENLRDAGYGRELPALSGLGYQQLWEYLAGERTLDEAIERIKFETHRFVRHQNNWFKRGDWDVAWFDVLEGHREPVESANYPADVLLLIEQFYGNLLGLSRD